MQWIKWIRKNRQRIMTFVVVFCMIAFVGGYGLEQFLMYLGSGGKQTIATFDRGSKITNVEMSNAQQELEIIKAVGGAGFLFYKQTPFRMPDTSAQLLGHLLFGDSQSAAQLRGQLKQMIQQGQPLLSTAQVDAFFTPESERPEILWILLNAEAQQAGVAVSNKQAAEFLRSLMTQMSGGQPVNLAAIIQNIASQYNSTDKDILATFAKLLAILTWTEQVCDMQNVTMPQITADIGRNMESLDINYAAFDARRFISQQAEPSAEQIAAQFEAYKNSQPNRFSDANPFGFGYLLPHRVQMEYIVIKNDDIAALVAKPTSEEMEAYYSANLTSQFQESVPVDPNKPDGEKKTITHSFAEKSEQIRRTLEQERADKQKQIIVKEIRDLADAKFASLDMEKATVEQLMQAAVDFNAVAKQIGDKYKLDVRAGKTGLLSPDDLSNDNALRSLRFEQAGQSYQLCDAVMMISADGKQAKTIGQYIPKQWETIGTLSGGLYDQQANKYYALTAIARVIGVYPPQTADNVDVAYSIDGIRLKDSDAPKIFRLEDKVIEDIKLVSAMETAKKHADEFKALAAKNWDNAIEEYNTKYAPKDPNKAGDAEFKPLVVQTLSRQILVPQSDMDRIQRFCEENPLMAQRYQSRIAANMLNVKYSELLGEKTDTGTIADIVEFKPQTTVYVVKQIKRNPATTKDLTDNTAMTALRTTVTTSASLGLTHLNPDNIKQRMNYKSLIAKDSETPTPNAEGAAEDAQ